MNPTLDRQVGLEQPGLENTPGLDAPVVTASSALGAPDAPIQLDAPDAAEAPAPKADSKPLARPDQVMLIEDNIEAVRAMKETGYVRGRQLDEFLETGNASLLTEAQAKRICDGLKPAPEADAEPPVALSGEEVSPAAAPGLDHESDEDMRREENNWAGQPATEGMVREMNRVMKLRGDAVAAVIASWQQAGVDVMMPSAEVTAALKGDFKDLKAAEQASNIAGNAARRLSEWESIRANKDGVPYDPATTVGAYTTERVKAKLADLDAVPPAIKDAIQANRALVALADAATAKNRSILESVEKAGENAYKPSRFDYAPNLSRALQFAIAANPGQEPEAICQSMKMAFSAGTVGVLYRLADALGVKDVAKVKVSEKKAEPRTQGGKGPKDPDWAAKPIDKRDAEKLAGAIAAKGFDALPDWAKQRLGGDITKVGTLSQGDFAKLRKAGVVENAQTGTGGKKPFNPDEIASPKTVEKVKESTADLSKLKSELAEKVTKVRAGEAVSLTKGEVADLRKAKVIE